MTGGQLTDSHHHWRPKFVAFPIRGGNGCGFKLTALPKLLVENAVFGGSGCGFKLTLSPG
jgi:hypothetical protein